MKISGMTMNMICIIGPVQYNDRKKLIMLVWCWSTLILMSLQHEIRIFPNFLKCFLAASLEKIKLPIIAHNVNIIIALDAARGIEREISKQIWKISRGKIYSGKYSSTVSGIIMLEIQHNANREFQRWHIEDVWGWVLQKFVCVLHYCCEYNTLNPV